MQWMCIGDLCMVSVWMCTGELYIEKKKITLYLEMWTVKKVGTGFSYATC